MAGLCEGGNEPPGSLKASKSLYRRPPGTTGSLDRSPWNVARRRWMAPATSTRGGPTRGEEFHLGPTGGLGEVAEAGMIATIYTLYQMSLEQTITRVSMHLMLSLRSHWLASHYLAESVVDTSACISWLRDGIQRRAHYYSSIASSICAVYEQTTAVQLVTDARSILPDVYTFLLTSSQQGAIPCAQNIMRRHFGERRFVIVSMPTTKCDSDIESSYCDYVRMTEQILKIIHNDMSWPVIMSRSGFQEERGDLSKEYLSYVVILKTGIVGEIIQDLTQQFENIKDLGSLNPRGRFLIVSTETLSQTSKEIAFSILKELWESYKILNAVVLQETRSGPHFYDLHSWFPYTTEGNCDNITEAVLVGSCAADGTIVTFGSQELYPTKITKNLQGCPLRVSTSSAGLGVVLAGTEINQGNETVYKYSGIEIECLMFILRMLNMTPHYLPPPPVEMSQIESHLSMLLDVVIGSSDVTLSTFPVHYFLNKLADGTISYYKTHIKWFVPCSRPIQRSEKIFKIFSLSVWLSMSLVFIQMSAVFWWLARFSDRSALQESLAYKSVSNCVYNVWAVTLGVSVPAMPCTSKLRIFFMLLVGYCFVMSTIFQIFFTSFLVVPGIHKQVTSFEELMSSGLIYKSEQSWDNLIKLTSEEYHSGITLPRRQCVDGDTCLLDMLTSHDGATITSTAYVDYFTSSVLRLTSDHKPFCSIEEPIFRMDIAMYLAKNNPLLPRFDEAIFRMLEAGLVRKFEWDMTAQLRIHYNHFRSIEKRNEEEEASYFVFSMAHLHIAFYILILGYSFSLIIFILEICYMRYSSLLSFV
ncbi:hypothetical protein ANN_13403 [Periplaneta americana]|uniref:Ionotropic glutamate receptor C-terminal domain-containing protein n=1 Tax=Periplaneta americana TaxID=6978 RepID=A0ABQ8TKR4_PERAM|nr:hypothetical protein ANN_13403 [Periplaneta americana]